MKNDSALAQALRNHKQCVDQLNNNPSRNLERIKEAKEFYEKIIRELMKENKSNLENDK